MNNSTWYSRFAKATARFSGRPRTFTIAVSIILIWIITGPIFDFSDTWQLVINTGTTIVTFLMVFLIQNTQNRDTEALQLKVDELLRISAGNNALMDIEELSDDQLCALRKDYVKLARLARVEKDKSSVRRAKQQQSRAARAQK